MSDISMTIKKRLLRMRAEGASTERQQQFIIDAMTCNRRYARDIQKMAEALGAGLVVQIGKAKSSALKTHCASASLKEQLNSKKGTMEFWYLAVNLTAHLRKELLSEQEIETVKILKSESMLSGQVCNALGISKDLLRKLDAQNQLPHRFKKMMDIKGHRMAVRCWLLHDVHAFQLAGMETKKLAHP